MNRARVLTPAALLVVVAAVVAFFVATSSGSTKTPQPSTGVAAAISIKQTGLGRTLVDASGRSLYLFEADQTNMSTLSAAGRAVWPPFTSATTPQASGGAAGARIGTIAGTGQVTYNGHPLYYYVGDQKPGQTAGQGLNEFGALWYVLSPQGNAVVSAPKSVPPAGGGSSSAAASNYGY